MYNTTKTITFSNLSPVNDTVSSPTFVFNSPAGNQTVNVNTGPVIGGFQTNQINDGGTGNFELVNFANKTSATVNTQAGDDTITVNDPVLGTGLTTLNVNAAGGNDTLKVQSVPAGLTVNADTGSGTTDVINIGLSGSLAAIQGSVFVKSTGGSATLNIDDSADPTGRTFNVSSTQVAGGRPGESHRLLGRRHHHPRHQGGHRQRHLQSQRPRLRDRDHLQHRRRSRHGHPQRPIDAGEPERYHLRSPHLQPGQRRRQLHQHRDGQRHEARRGAGRHGPDDRRHRGPGLHECDGRQLHRGRPRRHGRHFVASINWGDGTPSSGGSILANGTTGYDVLGNHTYAHPGTYPVNVTLTDLGSTGSTVVGGTTINVVSQGPVNSSPNPIASTAAVATAP